MTQTQTPSPSRRYLSNGVCPGGSRVETDGGGQSGGTRCRRLPAAHLPIVRRMKKRKLLPGGCRGQSERSDQLGR